MKDKKEEELDKEESDEKIEAEEAEPNKYFQSSPSDIYSSYPKIKKGKRIPFILGIAIIILILGSALYFLKARPGSQPEPTPSPQSISPVEETPSPSPKVTFDRSKYTLRVLNGTKTQGLAASTSANLKDLGYKIEKTANATNSAFLKTVVRVKSDLKDLLVGLVKDLSALDFKGEKGPQLKDSDSADGEVILGAD